MAGRGCRTYSLINWFLTGGIYDLLDLDFLADNKVSHIIFEYSLSSKIFLKN